MSSLLIDEINRKLRCKRCDGITSKSRCENENCALFFSYTEFPSLRERPNPKLNRKLRKENDNNKKENVRISTDLLQRYEWSPFPKDLVTGNGPWLLFNNLKRKKVSILPGG
ncbi:hypothetical protein TNIN_192891 [Trichonephila inaurata madagascariensis]|uniref:Uncharacterized protein n=1 Tax=Trichonephila inaurata madagascariensis TaxID=2747483 RepID=A0A8X6YTG7_9ARAC|nr:hypothetical protein TNIN_192891 [Trichonephila inaurata madagascariensis]